jgi:hypothetical protein
MRLALQVYPPVSLRCMGAQSCGETGGPAKILIATGPSRSNEKKNKEKKIGIKECVA